MNNFNDIEFRFYEKLDSTNLEARRLIKLQKPMWIFTKLQIQGRGRKNKEWISDVDNFTASLLYFPRDCLAQFPFRSYVAGLALFDTVTYFGIKDNNLIIKWPNDLLLNKKKVGGILLESVFQDNQTKPALIVGFGVNICSFPVKERLKNTEIEATSLAKNLDKVPDLKIFLEVLNKNYEYWENFLLTRGFNFLKHHFLKKTTSIGQELKVKLSKKVINGSFIGISDDGSLLLQSGNDIVTVTAGDVQMVGA